MRIVSLLLFLLCFAACKKPGSGDEVSGPATPGTPGTAATQSVSVSGRVTDPYNSPARGAQVRVGNKTATTDVNGYFSVSGAQADTGLVVVSVEKQGFYKAWRTFAPAAGGNQVAIKLMDRYQTGTVSSATGGSVSLPNGSTVTLPANGIVNAADSSIYTGTVRVFAVYIDPTQSDIAGIIPGSLMAMSATGERRVLRSYGMMNVELEGAGGQKLQLKRGSTATLGFTIPATLQSTAPATIPLWYLDEKTGLWKEEGQATKQGSSYTGTVQHFTPWNCDVSFGALPWQVTLRNASGAALPGFRVVLHVPGQPALGSAYLVTSTQGTAWTWIPDNQPLQMKIIDYCGNLVSTQNIGPFQQFTHTQLTVNTSIVSGMIKGRFVSCSGGRIGQTSVEVYLPDNTHLGTIEPDSLGYFRFPVYSCQQTSAAFKIIALDYSTMQQVTKTITLTGDTTDLGNLPICSDPPYSFSNLELGTYGSWVQMDYSCAGCLYSLSQTTSAPGRVRTTVVNQVPTSVMNYRLVMEGPAGTGAHQIESLELNGSPCSFPNPTFMNVSLYPGAVGQHLEARVINAPMSYGTTTTTLNLWFRQKRTN